MIQRPAAFHLIAFATLALFTLVSNPSSHASSPLESALAVEFDAGGRDAIVVRAADGAGAIVFRPNTSGGFELDLYPGMGHDVVAVSVGHVNRDAHADLVLEHVDGSHSAWLGDGTGRFLPEPETVVAGHAHAGHVHPVHRAERPDLQALVQAAELSTKRLPAEESLPRGVRSAAVLDDRAAARESVLVTDDGSLALRRGNDPERLQDLSSLIPGIAPRLVVAGRFLHPDRSTIAVIGAGARPRLVLLVPSDSQGPASAAKLDLAPQEQLLPTATFMVNVGQAGFQFVPNSVSIQVGDTVQWNWSSSAHNVISGTDCTPNNLFCSPTNTSCATAPTSASGATYSRVFPSAGVFPYFCNPHCDFGMTGSVTVQAAAAPGAVPNGTTVPGTPLRLGKTPPSSYTATWGGSCSAGANNYALYEGTLPIVAGVYSHVSVNCNLGNVTTTTFTTALSNAYYLIVPETAASEGSYGRGTAGEIPQGGGACRTQLLAACP